MVRGRGGRAGGEGGRRQRAKKGEIRNYAEKTAPRICDARDNAFHWVPCRGRGRQCRVSHGPPSETGLQQARVSEQGWDPGCGPCHPGRVAAEPPRGRTGVDARPPRLRPKTTASQPCFVSKEPHWPPTGPSPSLVEGGLEAGAASKRWKRNALPDLQPSCHLNSPGVGEAERQNRVERGGV